MCSKVQEFLIHAQLNHIFATAETQSKIDYGSLQENQALIPIATLFSDITSLEKINVTPVTWMV